MKYFLCYLYICLRGITAFALINNGRFMHFLSDQHIEEFTAVPELARFTTVVHAPDESVPALLVKSSSYKIRHLVRQDRLRIVLIPLESQHLLYGIEIEDYSDSPLVVWSVLASLDEREALLSLAECSECEIFLFNEAMFNVARCRVTFDLDAQKLRELVALSPSDDISASVVAVEADRLLVGYLIGTTIEHACVINALSQPIWQAFKGVYISGGVVASSLLITEEDEGGQQEELALWITDHLHPLGTFKSPQILVSGKERELIDILMVYECASFLFESKALSVFSRCHPATRAELSQDLTKHVDKAAGQLKGALKKVRNGYRTTDVNGTEILIETANPAHLIVLVPDLALLDDAYQYGGAFIRSTLKDFESFFHILDPMELSKISQAAQMISTVDESMTLIMAFDYYLRERTRRAIRIPVPNFRMLFRVEDGSE